MAQLSPYLSFSGDCRAALSFYQQCLGGELALTRFGDSPVAAQVPAEAQDHILHGTLTAGALVLAGSDAGSLRGALTVGTNVALALDCASDDEITTLFARLGEGGTIIDPLADMFWGGKFGALTDRFGIRWLFNYDKPATH
ncbi:VOC family protein [Hymenobacter cheonanensis]|uniref:VOC family protein n=1 Tax=Hymenobacter sp. CA2-7 TaxID=3063993 RepID=UPI00271225D5|nr:VOC family protein [Hymenobacter sp. CA2-7]MDO7886337.1 VOC family protein [Hymenobacter sp. CA2-7]